MYCPKCAAQNPDESQFCGECGAALPVTQTENPPPGAGPRIGGNPGSQPGRSTVSTASTAGSKKVAAGVLAILLGSLGIHKFYLGYHLPGAILLAAGTVGWLLVFPGLAAVAVGIIEGVIYLTKSDDEFNQTYIANQRPWF
jgi:TM2 domain-containing membrane protein YozV